MKKRARTNVVNKKVVEVLFVALSGKYVERLLIRVKEHRVADPRLELDAVVGLAVIVSDQPPRLAPHIKRVEAAVLVFAAVERAGIDRAPAENVDDLSCRVHAHLVVIDELRAAVCMHIVADALPCAEINVVDEKVAR